jgi:sialic acid synthase SpsE
MKAGVVDNRAIGPGGRPYVIAEASVTHAGGFKHEIVIGETLTWDVVE